MKNKIGRPKTNKREITKSTQEGLKEGWERATFILQQQHIENIKALAFWEREQIKETINKIMEYYFVRYKPTIDLALSEYKKSNDYKKGYTQGYKDGKNDN